MTLDKTIVIIDDKLEFTKEFVKAGLEAVLSNWEVVVEDEFCEGQIPLNAYLVMLHRSQFSTAPYDWSTFKAKFSTTEIYGTGAGGTEEINTPAGDMDEYLGLNWSKAISRWEKELDNWNGSDKVPFFPIDVLIKKQVESTILFEHLAALDIMVQGYLAAIYLAKGTLTIKEVEQVFEALKTNKGRRSKEELAKEASEGELAPFRLFRPLCMKNGLVYDNSQDKVSSKLFHNLAEGYYWFDSVLYEVYSDCPEALSGDPFFFISAIDAEVQNLAKFLEPGNEADLLEAILGLDASLIAAKTLCEKLRTSVHDVYKGLIKGGAIRTIWELLRSGLNKEVASHNGSFSVDATPIFESLGPLFCEKWSGADNREDIIETLFSLAFLEFRKAHELVAKAEARKNKLKNFREQRTKLNHSYLKNDFLSIFGPFRSPPYDVDGMSEELLGLDFEQGKHNDAIKCWKERIKPELLKFFTGDSFDSNIKPKESFRALAKDCGKRIEVLDHFVVKVWPGFFQLEINARKKEAKSFFAAGINLYQAIRSLRVELEFFKYFSVRD